MRDYTEEAIAEINDQTEEKVKEDAKYLVQDILEIHDQIKLRQEKIIELKDKLKGLEFTTLTKDDL